MEFPIRASPLSLRDRALLETMYSTGARVSEVVGINLDDLNEADGIVCLRGKGRKERIVPIGDLALHAIRNYRASLTPPARNGSSVVSDIFESSWRPDYHEERRSHGLSILQPSRGWSGQSPRACDTPMRLICSMRARISGRFRKCSATRR